MAVVFVVGMCSGLGSTSGSVSWHCNQHTVVAVAVVVVVVVVAVHLEHDHWFVLGPFFSLCSFFQFSPEQKNANNHTL